MFRYAQINEFCLVVGVSCLSGPITSAYMVEIDEYDPQLIGMVYDKSTQSFTEKEQDSSDDN